MGEPGKLYRTGVGLMGCGTLAVGSVMFLISAASNFLFYPGMTSQEIRASKIRQMRAQATPTKTDAKLSEARSLYRLRNNKEALKLISELEIVIGSENVEIELLKGKAYEAGGDFNRAKWTYQKHCLEANREAQDGLARVKPLAVEDNALDWAANALAPEKRLPEPSAEEYALLITKAKQTYLEAKDPDQGCIAAVQILDNLEKRVGADYSIKILIGKLFEETRSYSGIGSGNAFNTYLSATQIDSGADHTEANEGMKRVGKRRVGELPPAKKGSLVTYIPEELEILKTLGVAEVIENQRPERKPLPQPAEKPTYIRAPR